MIEIKPNTIDKINVALIILSLTAAFLIPFKLFLFSYAVLGPLHYLTEINWLKEKNFFVKDRRWIWLFVFFTLLISAPSLLHLSFFASLNQAKIVYEFNMWITGYTDILLLSMFFLAIGLTFFKNTKHVFIFLILSIIAAKLITKYILLSYILVGLFLPTIIHVYIFTLLFMIMGALNSKSRAGLMGVVILILAPILIFAVNINPEYYLNSESVDAINTARSFRFIQYLTEQFNKIENSQATFLTLIGVKIQIFTAFCYTYHYLNWFSKTSIIGWHKNVSRSKFTIILTLWLSIIFLFWYDYETAYLALFFLAMLHIILEFPLNITSIKEIVAKIYSKQA